MRSVRGRERGAGGWRWTSTGFVVLAVACGADGATTSTGRWVGDAAVDDAPKGASPVHGDPWPTADASAPTVTDGSAASADAARPPSPDAAAAPYACTGKSAHAAGANPTTTETLVSGGLTRSFIVHVPPSYDPSHGAMLVLDFHGFAMTAAQQEALTGFDGVADARGFVVVHPDGIARSWNAGDCCGDAWTGGVDDVAFTDALVAHLEAELCIDPKRVYAAGYSNGGFLAHRLGCERASTFAAIGAVAGVLGVPPASCAPSRPVPVWDAHGTSDPVIPYDGGTPIVPIGIGPLVFRSVAATIDAWRGNDGCLGAETPLSEQGDARCVLWGACAHASEIRLCTISGGGHTWPGGGSLDPILGKTSTDLDATGAVVDFFDAHPMP